MNTLSLRDTASAPRSMQLVLSCLEKIKGGMLEVRLPDGSNGQSGSKRVVDGGEHCVTMQVHDMRLFDQVMARGDIGLAESYIAGDWDSNDLVRLLTLLANNRDTLRHAIYGRWHALLAARLQHWLNRNSRTGSKRNIEAHYDLGNDFYRLWLDQGMSYSSACFDGDRQRTLEAAQHAKLRRILERLQPKPGTHILEIGCGWGGFAEMAARDYGCRVTGLTLSQQQLSYGNERMLRAGLDHLVTLRLQDYRDLDETFDHVVSIEMVEAVGQRWWPTYFRTLAAALKPGGRAIVQSITIADALFDRYRRGTDFIQQYVFPGGMLPSPSRFVRQVERAGLQVSDQFSFGADYAETLKRWRDAFHAQRKAVPMAGFDESFIRLWEFYLCYCEAGFHSGSTDVHQFELTKRCAGRTK